jgi:hypothetical protein
MEAIKPRPARQEDTMTATAVETTETVPAEDPRPEGFRPEAGLGRWQVTFSCHPLAFTSWAIYAESPEQARERAYVIHELDADQRAAADANVTVHPLPAL